MKKIYILLIFFFITNFIYHARAENIKIFVPIKSNKSLKSIHQLLTSTSQIFLKYKEYKKIENEYKKLKLATKNKNLYFIEKADYVFSIIEPKGQYEPLISARVSFKINIASDNVIIDNFLPANIALTSISTDNIYLFKQNVRYQKYKFYKKYASIGTIKAYFRHKGNYNVSLSFITKGIKKYNEFLFTFTPCPALINNVTIKSPLTYNVFPAQTLYEKSKQNSIQIIKFSQSFYKPIKFKLQPAKPQIQPIRPTIKKNKIKQVPKLKPKVYVTTSALIDIQRKKIKYNLMVDFEVLRSDINTLIFQLPDNLKIETLEGDRIYTWKLNENKGKREVTLYFSSNFKGFSGFILRLEYLFTSINNKSNKILTIPFIKFTNVVRQKGYIGLVSTANKEIEEQSALNLFRIDPDDLPEKIKLLVKRPTLIAYKFFTPDIELKIKLKKFKDMGVLTAFIKNETSLIRLTKSGYIVSKTIYEIQSRTSRHLKLNLAEGMQILTCKVNNRKVIPSLCGKNQVKIPILNSVTHHSDKSVKLEIVTKKKNRELKSFGELQVFIPGTSMPIIKRYCRIVPDSTYVIYTAQSKNFDVIYKPCEIMFKLPYIIIDSLFKLISIPCTPNFSRARKRSRYYACISKQKSIKGAIQMYKLDNSDNVFTQSGYLILNNKPTYKMNKLVKDGYLPHTIKCPDGGNIYWDAYANECKCSIHGSISSSRSRIGYSNMGVKSVEVTISPDSNASFKELTGIIFFRNFKSPLRIRFKYMPSSVYKLLVNIVYFLGLLSGYFIFKSLYEQKSRAKIYKIYIVFTILLTFIVHYFTSGFVWENFIIGLFIALGLILIYKIKLKISLFIQRRRKVKAPKIEGGEAA